MEYINLFAAAFCIFAVLLDEKKENVLNAVLGALGTLNFGLFLS